MSSTHFQAIFLSNPIKLEHRTLYKLRDYNHHIQFKARASCCNACKSLVKEYGTNSTHACSIRSCLSIDTPTNIHAAHPEQCCKRYHSFIKKIKEIEHKTEEITYVVILLYFDGGSLETIAANQSNFTFCRQEACDCDCGLIDAFIVAKGEAQMEQQQEEEEEILRKMTIWFYYFILICLCTGMYAIYRN